MLNAGEVSALDREGFTRLIGPVFEHSPWIAERTWTAGPFASPEHLHAALCRTVAAASDEERIQLIRAHPDLAGRMQLTRESRDEQKGAGLDQLSADEHELFESGNRQYFARFGFPFVICARLNEKEGILAALRRRLANSPEQEQQNALEEIYKIANLRLRNLVA